MLSKPGLGRNVRVNASASTMLVSKETAVRPTRAQRDDKRILLTAMRFWGLNIIFIDWRQVEESAAFFSTILRQGSLQYPKSLILEYTKTPAEYTNR